MIILPRLLLWLSVNGEIQQDASLADQIWNVSDVIAFCSQSVTLKAGDLIFTGTPAGVGAVTSGDVVTGGIESIGDIAITIGPSA